jgi:hypothetical protein
MDWLSTWDDACSVQNAPGIVPPAPLNSAVIIALLQERELI